MVLSDLQVLRHAGLVETLEPAASHVTVDQFVGRPPERVWEAITTPGGLVAWWVPGDIAPVVGHRFLLEMPGWGNVDREVLEVDEPHRLVYTFGDWTPNWFLVAEGPRTRVVGAHRLRPRPTRRSIRVREHGPGMAQRRAAPVGRGRRTGLTGSLPGEG